MKKLFYFPSIKTIQDSSQMNSSTPKKQDYKFLIYLSLSVSKKSRSRKKNTKKPVDSMEFLKVTWMIWCTTD